MAVKARYVALAIAAIAAGAALREAEVLPDFGPANVEVDLSGERSPYLQGPSDGISKSITADWQQRQRRNEAFFEGLEDRLAAAVQVAPETATVAGAFARSAVFEELGEPDFVDEYAGGVKLWHYRTSERMRDGLTHKGRETTALLLVGDSIIAAGRARQDRTSKRPDRDWERRQEQLREQIQGLAIGMERSAVRKLLGRSDFTDRVGGEGRILFYRTHSARDDGVTDKYTETTALVFLDDVLVAKGMPAPVSPATELSNVPNVPNVPDAQPIGDSDD